MMRKHYIEIDNDNYITKAFSDAFEQPTDTSICVNEKGSRHFHLELINNRGEFKYKYLNNEFVEQTEQSQAFIKSKLLADLKAYYQECKNINITIDNKTITHLFNSKWRNLLHTKISSLLIARKQGSPDTFTWAAGDNSVTLTVEQLEQLLYEIEENIMQTNYNNLEKETAYIEKNDVTLDYDYKKNFLHNQVINL
tara:strand:- start:11898 stop:12485 length:588 start_codon:yes stop_codon:yes gene_type:complete